MEWTNEAGTDFGTMTLGVVGGTTPNFAMAENTHTGTQTMADLTANRTWTWPDAAGTVELQYAADTTDVSNPPTDAEIDAIFGTPATVGSGFGRYIDDNGAGTNFYSVVSDGTNWWVFTGTKAL